VADRDWDHFHLAGRKPVHTSVKAYWIYVHLSRKYPQRAVLECQVSIILGFRGVWSAYCNGDDRRALGHLMAPLLAVVARTGLFLLI
jgi:hypothetical protein